MSDELRAAEALAVLEKLDHEQIEQKADIPAAILDVENRDVTTLFSVDTVDRVGDITAPHAFNRSIGLGVDRIPHLFQHDDRRPAIARILKIEPVTKAQLPADVVAAHPEASGGCVAVSRFLKTGRGAEVFEGIKEGIAYGASFGFITKKAVPHPTIRLANGKPARVLDEVHLVEVTTALPGTAINPATRSALIGKALALIEEAKAGWRHGKHTDIEVLNQIAIWLLDMGANNIQLIPDEPAQPARPARTSDGDALMESLREVFEVST